jgi:hypothetical protein
MKLTRRIALLFDELFRSSTGIKATHSRKLAAEVQKWQRVVEVAARDHGCGYLADGLRAPSGRRLASAASRGGEKTLGGRHHG